MIRISSPDANVTGSVLMRVINARILSIELLEGDTERTDPEVIQYVNIQQNKAEHVDGIFVTHADRLGQKLRCRVRFDRVGVFAFRVRLIPEPDNMSYTSTEKNRNANFRYCDEELYFTTEPNGEKIIETGEFFVSPAGGDVFSILALDSFDNEIWAVSRVRTCRLLYYQEIKMQGLPSIIPNFRAFRNEFKKYGIEFIPLTPVGMEHIRNIDSNDGGLFKNKVMTVYNSSEGQAKDPYCIAMTFIDQSAHMSTQTIRRRITVDSKSDKLTLRLKDGKFLWDNSIDDTSWLIDCCFDQTHFCGLLGRKTDIGESQFRLLDLDSSGWNAAVEIDLKNLPRGRGELVLKVNTIEGMCGGFSFLENNIITVCTKSWGLMTTEDVQLRTMIHETGHQLGMVCDGSGKLPDRVVTFYDEHGHTGRHCNNGLSESQKTKPVYGEEEIIRSICVMYGCGNGKKAFCSNCAEALRKLSLEDGFQI